MQTRNIGNNHCAPASDSAQALVASCGDSQHIFSQSDRIHLPGSRMMTKRYSPRLKEGEVEGCTDGTVGLSLPFHDTISRNDRSRDAIQLYRAYSQGNIRTFVRPGFVGLTAPSSSRPPPLSSHRDRDRGAGGNHSLHRLFCTNFLLHRSV